MSLTPEQIEQRRHGVSASEVPCIVGVSPFGNAHSVWCEKMQIPIKRAESTQDAMDLGNYLEEGVGRLYADRTKRTLGHFGTVAHARFPRMMATPDFAVFGERRIAQIKLVGPWMAHHWDDGVPEYVVIQVQQEMEVADADVCDVVAVICGTDLRIIPVERDWEIGRDLAEICTSFYDRFIATKEMPEVDGSDAASTAIRAMYRKQRPEYIAATPDAERWGVAWVDADGRIRDAEKDQALAEQNLKLLIGDHAGIEGESFRATWLNDKNLKRTFRVKQLGQKRRAA